jgi:tetratricopeptide (TPR) repeat protein
MKKVPLFLLFVVLAATVSAESAVAPTPAPASPLSFSVTPNMTIPVGPKGELGGGIAASQWFAPGWGATISCQYRLPSSPLYIGVDLGYSWVPFGDWASSGIDPFKAWPLYRENDAIIKMSMFQAGLGAGIQLDILPTVGIRGFGSAGYSYNSLSHNLGRGGTAFVCAGAELVWTFIPALSLTAGAKYRHFFDLYEDLAVTLGISYNLLVGGAHAARPATQRVAPPAIKAEPLNKATHPQPPTKPEGVMIEKLSLFLTPKEPALLFLSDQISSFVQPHMNRAIDKNLQSAIGFYEALRLLGIAYVSPPLTSYAVASKNKTALDSVKFPLQTIQDRSGDCSDLSILCISLLESVQVETAFITTPGHVFMAFALASSEEEARKTFSHADELIFRDGEVWMPIEVTERAASFLAAWQAGAKEWRKAKKQAHFYPVGSVGNIEPVGSTWSGSQPPLPDQAMAMKNFQQEVALLVAWEIHDREAELMAAVSQSKGSPNTLNALGVLYARYDLLDKAEAQFQAAVETSEYVPALVNLGNLRLRGKLTEEALGFYQRAAAVAPHDPAILLGLSRSNHELQNYELVKEEYDELQTRSPELAAQFSYLGLQGEEAAAEANQLKEIMVWGEEK